ncbi:MAG: phage terminase large subunit family protein, partial [Geminicoccaceae bacterium]
MTFSSLEDIVVATAEGVRPPERLTVPQAAEKYRYINNRGSYVGPWRNDTTPYLVEPMQVLTSLRYTGMVFVGSAQAGKTELYLNWHAYTVLCDPADLMLVQTSQTTASDFSKRRIDRLHRDTKPVGEKLLAGRHHDNTFDKRYMGGSMVTLSWPTVNELSGKPIPRLFLTDYDRMTQDIDGNGSPFDLAAARTTTFRRHGMTVAESSPSYPVLDPRWSAASKHEAPPTEGILALYNRGDRRRWYWICASCGHAFEPDFSLMKWHDTLDFLEAGETAWMECPHCRARYLHDNGDLPGKHAMNASGTWLRDGEMLTPEGEVVGTPTRSLIASFWLKGVCAAFSDWTKLVSKYLMAETEFVRTGSEDALKATVNVDQGVPYLPKSMESERAPEALKDRARDYGYKVVPPGVRFLIAAIDVQKNRFEVQIHGVGQGGDIWVVDRFQIRHSRRPDPEREGQVHYVRPFVYKEDWRLLLDEVILRTYELGDGSGRHMAIKGVICDSGGQDEGTSNGYEFYRWLKHGPNPEDPDSEDWPDWTPGLHSRFQLYKGASTRGAPRVRITYPDSQRKDRAAGARGEIPVLFVNTNIVKNQIDAMLEREKDHGGKIHFPSWLEIGFFKELCVEVKNLKGEWENPKRFR